MSRRKIFCLLFGAVVLVACGEPASVSNPFVPVNMVLVPAGEFVMGSDRVDTENKAREYGNMQPWYADEHPQHRVSLKAYFIDTFEVTHGEFAEFMIATQQVNENQLRETMAQQPPEWLRMPFMNVNWFYADAYCRWAGKRLPTEAEWEKAARGADGREYPWGNDFDVQRLNAGQGNLPSGIAPVGSFPEGKSPYGAYDMAGNVAEWTADWYQPYPGATFQSPAYGQTHKVVRGGGWGGIGHYTLPYFYRAAYRDFEKPDRQFNDIGFRCAKDAG